MPDNQVSDHELDRAIATTVGADGSRHLTLTADWNTPNGTANGGYVLAILMRAVLDVAVETAPAHPDPLTVSVSYLKPPTPGPAQVTVRGLRTGRRVSVHEATLLQGERPVAQAIISLHDWDAAGDVHHTPHQAPDVPAPADCHDLAAAIPAGTVPIADRYEVRSPTVPGWLSGQPSGTPEATVWVRPQDGRRIDAIAAAAIVDGYPPVTAELGLLASATVQLTVHLRRRPETDWSLMHVTTRHVVDGYHDEDVELWDSAGNLIAQSRQLAILS
ncbi:thioesterase family protein [Aeromicrobium sp. CTD01-1L150]|uniref:thioesterase family protein n=1 Tax=Aeromicrobium sp. CTD01-1L150 TaxID=3341830 RepID=UPI0035C064F9